MKKNMLLYYGKKIGLFLVSMMLLTILVFFIARLAPGDPLVSYYGDRVEKMSVQERAWAEEKLGLQEPVYVQFQKWLQEAFKGNFGISFKYKMDVLQVIEDRIGNTLFLGGISFVLIFVLSLALGMWCGYTRDSIFDRICCKVGTILSCVPEFWLSIVLIFFFSVVLQWFPSSGAYGIGTEGTLGQRMKHLVLPVTVIVVGHLWYYAYMIRNKFVEEMGKDYVLLAKSKGLSSMQILVKHCLRSVFPTYLSFMIISIPHILGGTYIVETVFSYPGIGTLMYESARYKDYNLLMILSILSGLVVILSNILGQMISEKIDPRVGGNEVRNHE